MLGFVLAWALFWILKSIIHDKHLFEPPKEGSPPVWWMRALLITTCTGVSFAHGTNDGLKSIGLIMLVIIGLLPANFALNISMSKEQISRVAKDMPTAKRLMEQYGDDQKQAGSEAAQRLADKFSNLSTISDIPEKDRISVRNDLNHVLSELKAISQLRSITSEDKTTAKSIHDFLMKSVEYAPWWVRILSALCLGIGTMVGYRRIVHTLGQRPGKQQLVPAQGASAELVAAVLIGGAGFSGFPVSTTHVVTGGIAGTMVGSGYAPGDGRLVQLSVRGKS